MPEKLLGFSQYRSGSGEIFMLIVKDDKYSYNDWIENNKWKRFSPVILKQNAYVFKLMLTY